MKTRLGQLFSTVSVVAILIGSSAIAQAFDGQQYAKSAHIKLHEARKIALNAHAGKIVAEELEKEKGGSGLRYSFDIRRGKVTHEVGVDAANGKVLENSVEGPNSD